MTALVVSENKLKPLSEARNSSSLPYGCMCSGFRLAWNRVGLRVGTSKNRRPEAEATSSRRVGKKHRAYGIERQGSATGN